MKTDLQLQSDIIEEMKWDPRLDGASIEVTVLNGIVILVGHTENYSKKLSTEDAVRKVKNVKGIVENITVQLSGNSQRPDSELAFDVLNALKWNNEVPDQLINLKVESGWITLEGTINWQFEKDAAFKAIKDITGIKGITNLIIIIPIENVPVVREKIKAALERSADIRADRIVVETSGNKIILRGKARSWGERNEAERVAWSSPGVKEVEDDLIISP